MPKPMNIAALSRTTYWHGMHGGMDVHGKLLAQGLAARGHRVVFICTRHPSGKTHEIDHGVELHYLPETVFGSRRHGWAEKSIQALADLHRQRPFDLVWSQSYDGFGLTAGHFDVSNLPLIATLHGSIQQEFTTFLANVRHFWNKPSVCLKGIGGLLYSYFVTQKPVLRHSRKIITASRRVTDDLRKWFGRDSIKKCVTVYNGIDTSVFHPDPTARTLLRNRYSIKKEDAVILTLGRLTHEKGHHVAIGALGILKRTIPDIKLLVVGGGNGLSMLKLMTEKLGLSGSVIFTGPVDNRETVAYYNAADIFLFPTLTIEGLPFVLLEAMACGKPVIASEIGGNTEVVRNGDNGILVKPGDPLVIADRVEMLVAHSEDTARLRRKAAETVSHNFTIDRMIDRTQEEMAQIAERTIVQSMPDR